MQKLGVGHRGAAVPMVKSECSEGVMGDVCELVPATERRGGVGEEGESGEAGEPGGE